MFEITWRRLARATAWSVCALAVGACAPRQPVPIELGPAPVEVYVDGERLEEPLPDELELTSNRGHVIFVKKEGHRSQQVILHSVEQADGPPRLEPDAVVVDLRRETPKGRRLEVELDDAGPAAVPGAPGEPTSPTEGGVTR